MKPGFIVEMDIRQVASGPPAYLQQEKNTEHLATSHSYGGRNMSESLKSDGYFSKPLKSAPAFVNIQSASKKEAEPEEDSAIRGKRALESTDTGHPKKSPASTPWFSQLDQYRGDYLGQLSRFEDGPSLCRLSGCKGGLSHGSLCMCGEATDPVNKFQDFAGPEWSVPWKNPSFTYTKEDCRNIRDDWNPAVPFPPLPEEFESTRVPFRDNLSFLPKTVLKNDLIHQSHDASPSLILLKLETQSKVIENLRNGLRRLEDERDGNTQLFRELRDEMISLNGQMAESHANVGLGHDLSVWKYQTAAEVRQLKSEISRFLIQDKDVVAENSDRMAELRHELSETKKFFSDEVKALRREIRKLLSRIGQLEVDMVGVLSENKGLHRRLQKLEKSVHSVVESQALLSRALCSTQNQRSKDRTDLEQVQRSYGCVSQKLNLLTLKANGGDHGILKDVPTASLRTTDLQKKTCQEVADRNSRLTGIKAKHRGHKALIPDVTLESSSLTSLDDTASTDKHMLAESCHRKKSLPIFIPNMGRAKKKAKRISKKGGSSDTFSQLPDVDVPDSLAETEGGTISLETDKGVGAEKDSGVDQKLLSAAIVEESASYSTTTITTTTTTSSSSSSSSSSTSFSSSSTSSTD